MFVLCLRCKVLNFKLDELKYTGLSVIRVLTRTPLRTTAVLLQRFSSEILRGSLVRGRSHRDFCSNDARARGPSEQVRYRGALHWALYRVPSTLNVTLNPNTNTESLQEPLLEPL